MTLAKVTTYVLTLADDFGTIAWLSEYPHPTIAPQEMRELLLEIES